MFYATSERQDPLPRLLNEWKTGPFYSRKHLNILVELVHETLKTLDTARSRYRGQGDDGEDGDGGGYGGRPGGKKRKAPKGAKDLNIEVYVASCVTFSVDEYFKRIVTNASVRLYTKLLAEYATNEPSVNHYAYVFLQRMCNLRLEQDAKLKYTPTGEYDAKLVSLMEYSSSELTLGHMLFNLPTIMTIGDILNDTSITNEKHMEPLLRLLKTVIRRFGDATKKNSHVFVEALFQHAHAHDHCVKVDSIYDAPYYVNTCWAPSVSLHSSSIGGGGGKDRSRVGDRSRDKGDEDEDEEEDEDEGRDNDYGEELDDEGFAAATAAAVAAAAAKVTAKAKAKKLKKLAKAAASKAEGKGEKKQTKQLQKRRSKNSDSESDRESEVADDTDDELEFNSPVVSKGASGRTKKAESGLAGGDDSDDYDGEINDDSDGNDRSDINTTAKGRDTTAKRGRQSKPSKKDTPPPQSSTSTSTSDDSTKKAKLAKLKKQRAEREEKLRGAVWTDGEDAALREQFKLYAGTESVFDMIALHLRYAVWYCNVLKAQYDVSAHLFLSLYLTIAAPPSPT
jgi:hypothetical protein